MSDTNKSVKEAGTVKQEPDNWLAEQTTIAAHNLKKRPIERRGPYALSDEDLQEKFSLN